MKIYRKIAVGLLEAEETNFRSLPELVRLYTKDRDNLPHLDQGEIYDGSFCVHSTPDNPKTTERVDSPIIGFWKHYGVAYISNPESNFGLIGIDTDNKRLLFQQNTHTFNKHRDAVVYIGRDIYYFHGTFEGALQEFVDEDYSFFRVADDKLIIAKDPSQIEVGEEIALETILNESSGVQS